MTCEELNGLLDGLMDGELSDEQRRAMDAHGASCPECAAAIRSTERLKALFDEMEGEVDVPLQAQAGWRSAVRAASRQRRGRGMYRWIATAAAAVVVLVGLGAAMNLRGAPKQENSAIVTATGRGASVDEIERSEAAEAPAESVDAVPVKNGMVSNAAKLAGEADEVDYDLADSAVVEADGGTADGAVPNALTATLVEEEAMEEASDAAAGLAAPPQRAPAFELSLHVEDVEKACDRIRDLVQEYDGSADVQTLADGGANIYVEIQSDDAEDFIHAAAPLDASGQSPALPDFSRDGTVLVLLTVRN